MAARIFGKSFGVSFAGAAWSAMANELVWQLPAPPGAHLIAFVEGFSVSLMGSPSRWKVKLKIQILPAF